MSLHVLITCPPNRKFFADLAASACFVKTQHPDLTLDLLVDSQYVPAWWSGPGAWLTVKTDVTDCQGPYELAIQTSPDPKLAQELAKIDCENRTGIVLTPNFHVQGRWAQTLLAQIGCRRFTPFTPFDLFNHVLLGRTTLDFTKKESNPKGEWIVDLDSFSSEARGWAESVMAQLSLTHPGHVRDRIAPKTNAQQVACYVGADSAAASWFSYHGTHTALIHQGSYSGQDAPANANAWNIPSSALPTPTALIALFNSKDLRAGSAFRHTTEYLGGQVQTLPAGKCDDPQLVFDRLHYIVFNYLNDLLEVDLPVPEVSASCCLSIKGSQAVFGKLVHLNQFGIKFLQEFLDKVKDGSVKDQDVNELTHKVNEIDELTNKTLSVYPELDLIRFWAHFSKAAASGESVVDIAKSLILVFHEINQALQAYDELISLIVQKHTKKEDIAGP